MNSLQEYMNSKWVTVSDPMRIDNLVTNAELAQKIEEKDGMLRITFSGKSKNRSQPDVVTFNLPLNKLSVTQNSKLLSYKNKK